MFFDPITLGITLATTAATSYLENKKQKKANAGRGDQQLSMSRLNPEQEKLLDQLVKRQQGFGRLNSFQDMLQRFSDPDAQENRFERGVVQPQMRQFSEQILPAIQSRMGNRGFERGGDVNRALSQAGVDFGDRLANLRFNAQEARDQRALQASQIGSDTEYRLTSLGLNQAKDNIYKTPDEYQRKQWAEQDASRNKAIGGLGDMAGNALGSLFKVDMGGGGDGGELLNLLKGVFGMGV